MRIIFEQSIHEQISITTPFLTSTNREWNRLPEELGNTSIIASFKSRRNQTNSSVPNYFCVGDRRSETLHTRIRTKYISLNYDVSLKHLTDSPLCHVEILIILNITYCNVSIIKGKDMKWCVISRNSATMYLWCTAVWE